MIYFAVLIWLLFMCVVIVNSRKKKAPLVDFSRKGSIFMNLVYFLFFTLMIMNIFIIIINSNVIPFFTYFSFCLPSCETLHHPALSRIQDDKATLIGFLHSKFHPCIFHSPLYSPLQWIGSTLLFIGFVLYLISIRFFSDNYFPFVGIKKNQTICTRGPYRYIRHPLYSFQILMMSGTAMVFQNFVFLFLPVVFYLFYRTAREEEKILTKHFKEYADYMQSTWRFVPYVF